MFFSQEPGLRRSLRVSCKFISFQAGHGCLAVSGVGHISIWGRRVGWGGGGVGEGCCKLTLPPCFWSQVAITKAMRSFQFTCQRCKPERFQFEILKYEMGQQLEMKKQNKTKNQRMQP